MITSRLRRHPSDTNDRDGDLGTNANATAGSRMSPVGAPLVVMRDLTVTFRRNDREVRAVRGVDLEIGRGEIVGMVGESGSGKTVLGLSVLGLLPQKPAPSVTGSLTVCGVDALGSSAEQRRLLRADHLGAVFQDPMTSLNPTMRVGRQVAERAGSEREALRLLDAVGIPEAKRRLRALPHELSGGLRQRVMIAIAIAGEPDLVIADEPTTALDVTVQAQILRLLRSLRDELGCSFLFVTHDLGVAAELADRIAVMYAGRFVEVGTTADVLDRPAHPYTAGLRLSRLTMTSVRHEPLHALSGEPPDPASTIVGCSFAPRCPIATASCSTTDPAPQRAPHPGTVACIHPDRVHETEVATASGWPPAVDMPGHLALECVGVTKSYRLNGARRSAPRLQALRGVDLRVAPGESVAIVGESGSGKSTLFRVIARLVEADGGSFTVTDGARPQMVFQDSGASLTPWLTVGEQIGERLREERMSRSERAGRVEQTLRLVGLPPAVAAARPGQLSGGQRQRVGIARAIVVPPTLLLCDEPTSALDVSLSATVLNLLGRLRRELGMAMLFVTHDLAAARVVADRIAVMYLGRIVEDGPVDELVVDPQHPYTQALLASVPGRQTADRPLVGDPASPIDPPTGCAFHPRCPVAEPTCSNRQSRLLQVRPLHHVDCVGAAPAADTVPVMAEGVAR